MFPSMKMDERLEYEFFDIFPAKLVLSLSLSLSLSFSLSFSNVMSLSEETYKSSLIRQKGIWRK